jgi:hypothetical protein
MIPMPKDEISEIRRIRHEISEECDHDIRKVAAYYREVGEELKKSGQFHFEQSREAQTVAAAGTAEDDK